MASRQPRPPWFRFSNLAPRAAVPPPPPPFVPSAPAPAVVRPTLPIRPPPQQRAASPPPPPPVAPPAPVQPTLPIRPPPQQRVASPPPPPPPAAPPPPPSSSPPRSPVRPPVPQPSPPKAPSAPRSPASVPAPQPSPPRAPAVAPPRSPVPQPAQPSPPRPQAAPPPWSPVASTSAAPRSPVPQPAQPSPPPVPPTATKSPLTSPSVKQALSTTSHAPPSSPITKSPAPSPTTRTSPIPNPVATKSTTPIPSPQTIKPFERIQSESPKLNPLSRPPSPFTLPPAQIKPDAEPEPIIEQKNVVMQQPTGAYHNNTIASSGKREPMSKAKGTSKKLSEELDLSAITLAGENKGAVMELSPSRKKYHTVGDPRTLNGYQSNNESGEERKSKNKEKANGGMKTQPSMMSYFNSNVQGLNNSIVFNTSFRHKDPGIHLSLRKANGDPDKDNYHHHG